MSSNSLVRSTSLGRGSSWRGDGVRSNRTWLPWPVQISSLGRGWRLGDPLWFDYEAVPLFIAPLLKDGDRVCCQSCLWAWRGRWEEAVGTAGGSPPSPSFFWVRGAFRKDPSWIFPVLWKTHYHQASICNIFEDLYQGPLTQVNIQGWNPFPLLS